jgi:hypothetical protein
VASWGTIIGTLTSQTDLQTALDAKAGVTHPHAIADVANLQTTLNGKAAIGHNHDSSYEILGAVAAHVAAADAHVGYQKESEKGVANGYASLGPGGLVPIAQIAAGIPTGAKFVRDDGVLAAPPGGGGGVSQLIVNLISDGAGITWTNMPVAVTFFAGSHRYATKVDLTNYTEARLIVNKQGTAGAAASVVRLRYITSFSTTVGNWLTIGSSEVQVAVNVTNTVLVSSWIPLVAGARADVFITLDGLGSDGILDPVFGSLVAQFR